MKQLLAAIKSLPCKIRGFFDESGPGSVEQEQSLCWYRYAKFWLHVARSFVRNRCPMRAAGLAYIFLIGLIPLLTVAVSVSTSILKDEGERRITEMIEKMVENVVPKGVDTNAVPALSLEHKDETVQPDSVNHTESDTRSSPKPRPTATPERSCRGDRALRPTRQQRRVGRDGIGRAGVRGDFDADAHRSRVQ